MQAALHCSGRGGGLTVSWRLGAPVPAADCHLTLSLFLPLQGSHLEPTLDLAAQLPEASASCTANLRRTAARVTLASPHADTAATLHLLPPSFEAVKAAVTQAQSTALAVPNVAGVDGEVGLRGLDVVPLLSGDGQAALRQLAVQSGQPLRLKLAGRAKVSGVVQREQAPQALATAAGQPAPTATATADAAASQRAASWEFAGDLGLESVRVNQLKLFQKLAARLSVSSTGVSVHGKGQRASETLDLHLALPPPGPAIVRQQHAAAPAAGTAAAVAPAGRVVSASAPEAPGAGNPGASAPDASATEDTVPAAASVPDMAQQGGMQRGGGGLQMRCGPLHVAADINAAGSQLDFKVGLHVYVCDSPAPLCLHRTRPPLLLPAHSEHVSEAVQAAGLKLDELELASLRGDLQVAAAWACVLVKARFIVQGKGCCVLLAVQLSLGSCGAELLGDVPACSPAGG